MNRRVVITGLGWTTPLGHEIEPVWKAILSGKSGAAPISLFDAKTFPSTFACAVKDFHLADHIPDPQDHLTGGRNTQFALAAAWKAWQDAGLDSFGQLDRTRVGIYLGCGEGRVDFMNFMQLIAEAWNEETSDLDAKVWGRKALETLETMGELEQEPNMPSNHLACLLGTWGITYNCLTACAASTQALGQATQIIRRGEADVMVSGGTHSMIHPLGVTGFNRLTALSTRNDEPKTASRPFDRTRDGFVLGEGAGLLILEEAQHALGRGATILAEVIGYGSSADAFRITDQHPEGRGAIQCMRQALADADIKPEAIQYISAHGTSTGENDSTETLALKAVFGENAYRIPVSSLKSMTGHLIAAAGAVELITCLLAMRDSALPPTINYHEPDPQCDLDYVPNKARRAEVNCALSNSFGFGGQNDTLIVRKWTS